MTTWKDGGDCGKAYREIINEGENYVICKVRTKQYGMLRRGSVAGLDIESWSEGKANFRLILQAPKMLEALEAIRDMTEPMLRSHLADIPATCAEWKTIRDHAIAAIAAVKGWNDGLED